MPTASAFNAIPSQFHSQELSSGSRGLGGICLSRDILPDGTVCNPAFLPEVQENLLLGRIYVGNGYTAFTTANQFIFQPISKEFLQQLFQQKNTTHVDANTQLVFTAPYFSAEFSPYRVQYDSEAHNPNFPVIAIHASIEKSLTFSSGVPLSQIDKNLEDFSIGVKLRMVQRDYVHGSFSLFDIVSSDPRTLLPVNKQYGIFVDPFLGWSSQTLSWKPRASISTSSLGKTWPNDPLYSVPVDIDIGVGLEPPVGFGRWRIGVDATNLIQSGTKQFFSGLRLGTSYQFGILELMTGINKDTMAAGLQFNFNILGAGIVYEFSESKLATEVSIRL